MFLILFFTLIYFYSAFNLFFNLSSPLSITSTFPLKEGKDFSMVVIIQSFPALRGSASFAGDGVLEICLSFHYIV